MSSALSSIEENSCVSPMSDQKIADAIKVGSRKSPLALVQTNYVVDKLREIYQNEKKFEIVTMSTIGDNILDKALSKIGEKSLFTKELEVALINKKVDFAVHSLKDLPTSLPENLAIGAICERENPHDVLVLHPKHEGKTLETLPDDSTIGTSSLRRIAQLKRQFPSLHFSDIRGNLNTRLKKLDEDDTYDALVLAAAGLIRMGWEDRISQILKPDYCMHAVGQGALAVECRANDSDTLSLIGKLNHKETVLGCIAERAMMKSLEGGCSVPLAVSTYYSNGQLNLKGGVFSLDGSEAVIDSIIKICEPNCEDEDPIPPIKKMRKSEDQIMHYIGIAGGEVPIGTLKSAELAGIELAKRLELQGAVEILNSIRKSTI